MRRTLSELIERKKTRRCSLGHPLLLLVLYLSGIGDSSAFLVLTIFIANLLIIHFSGQPVAQDYNDPTIDTKSAKNFSFVGIECHFV